jgi:plastocyanin
MARGEHPRRWRRWLSLCVAAVLGAAVVVMPALASSEGGPIQAGGSPPYYEWSPMSVSVNSGGQVTIKDLTSVEHGVHWTSALVPTCSGVPGASVGQPSFGKNWTGTCTFAKAGEYTFYCTVHGPPMSGKVVVNAAGETTVTTTATSTPGYPPPAPGGGGGNPSSPGHEAGSPQPPNTPSALTLLAGSASNAVKVAATQHGRAVHGSVAIAPAGEGGRLEVDLFARSGVLAGAGHGALQRIGRIVLAHVHAGAVRFSVPLSRQARRALARRHRLSVTVQVKLQSASATPITISRSVLLHP